MPYPSRNFAFTRTTTSRGLFTAPDIRFELRQAENDALVGAFTISGRNAEWMPADGNCSFRIRRAFWGQRWNYAGEAEGREFARISFGFFRRRISFADGGVYHMKLKRGGRLFPKRKYALLAEFFHEDDLRMTLMNTRRRKIFESDVRRQMTGSIDSSLPGMSELWGMLLLFQTYLHAQQMAATAS